MPTIGSINAEQLRRAGLIATHTHPLIVELRDAQRDLEAFYQREIHRRDLRIVELESKDHGDVTDTDLRERVALRERAAVQESAEYTGPERRGAPRRSS